MACVALCEDCVAASLTPSANKSTHAVYACRHAQWWMWSDKYDVLVLAVSTFVLAT